MEGNGRPRKKRTRGNGGGTEGKGWERIMTGEDGGARGSKGKQGEARASQGKEGEGRERVQGVGFRV